MTLRCILAPLASPDTLRGQVTDADWAAAAAFPPRRRAEYLTWRESETRRFTRAAAHFLTPAEAALGDDPRVAGVVWCAKETLYKLARRRGLDLLRDLAIERIDFAAGEVVGRIRGGEPIPMRLELREGLIVVHTL